MSDETKLLPFEELSDELQQRVKDHFSNSEYRVPEDWYEFVMEDINERYKDKLDIEKSIEFDMDRNDFSWKGNVDYTNSEIQKLMPNKLREYDDNGYLSFFSEAFKNGEMVGEYEVDHGFITGQEEVDIMPATISSKKTVMVKLEDVDIYKDLAKKYSINDSKLNGYIDGWFESFEAAGLFFQDEAEIDFDEYHEVAESILDSDALEELAQEVEIFMEHHAFDELSDYVSDAFDAFTKSMRDNYEYYFSDEYVLEEVSQKSYEVIFDDDGEQEDIVDLNGEW